MFERWTDPQRPTDQKLGNQIVIRIPIKWSAAPPLQIKMAWADRQATDASDSAVDSRVISSLLSSQLSTLEAQLAEIERLLTLKPTTTQPLFSEDEVREFLRKESKDFCQVLLGDPKIAKREIQKRIKKLVLTPRQTPNGTVLEVTGDVGLFQRPDVMVKVSWMKHLSITLTSAGYLPPLSSTHHYR